MAKPHLPCVTRRCLGLMAWCLTRVLARSSLTQVLLAFLLLRGFSVSGNRACWLMSELGENVAETKVLESKECVHVCVSSPAESGTTQFSIVFPIDAVAFHKLCITCAVLQFPKCPRTTFSFRTALLFIPAVNVLWTPVNVVLSQMLSSRVISCSHALIVMISSVFEAHVCVLCFANYSHCRATEYEQPNQTWPRFLYSSISHKPAPGELESESSIKQRRKLWICYFISLLVALKSYV